jgi:hypothetical protein
MQQKLLYNLLIASRKLHHYFQGHLIKVVTDRPLETIIRNPNCRCSGYRGIPVHLLLGPVIGPSSAQGGINDPSYGRRPSRGGAS